MSLSISENRNEILTAYKNVTHNDANNWVLFSYISNSKNQLEVVSKGEDGLEELYSEFVPHRIMYAIIKVEDPKTTLPKLILINWQGESVNGLMRGRAANHINDFSRLFKGIQLTIHARNEDDVDPELILAEISSASSTNYDFRNSRNNSIIDEDTNGTNIGTNYEPIKPNLAVASSKTRNTFWAKHVKEDQERIILEEKTKKEKESEIENERRKMEIASEKNRNKLIKERALKVAQLEKPQNIASSNIPSNSISNSTYSSNSSAVSSYTTNSNINKVENGNLAKIEKSPSNSTQNTNLVSENTSKVESLSSSNLTSSNIVPQGYKNKVPNNLSVTSSQNLADQLLNGNCNFINSSKKAESSQNSFQNQSSNALNNEIKLEQEIKNQSNQSNQEQSIQQPVFNNQDNINQSTNQNQNQDSQEQNYINDNEIENTNTINGNILDIKAVALYDYDADDDTEISFLPGDVITNIDQFDKGWWTGTGPDGKIGMFPANYVKIIMKE